MQILSIILQAILCIGFILFIIGVLVTLWETIKMSGRKDSAPLPWWVFWRS
jgi:hypothetical protein